MKGKVFRQGEYPVGTRLECVRGIGDIYTIGEVYSVISEGLRDNGKGNSHCSNTSTSRFVLTVQPHVHCDLIHQWADGAIIQCYFMNSGKWRDSVDNNPSWRVDSQYRVKRTEVIELERQIQAAQTGIDVAHNLLEDLTKQLEQANA